MSEVNKTVLESDAQVNQKSEKKVPLAALHEQKEKVKDIRAEKEALEAKLAEFVTKQAEAEDAKLKEEGEYVQLLGQKEELLKNLEVEKNNLLASHEQTTSYIKGLYDNELAKIPEDKLDSINMLMGDINPETNPLSALQKLKAVNKIIGTQAPVNMNVGAKISSGNAHVDELALLQKKIDETQGERKRMLIRQKGILISKNNNLNKK